MTRRRHPGQGALSNPSSAAEVDRKSTGPAELDEALRQASELTHKVASVLETIVTMLSREELGLDDRPDTGRPDLIRHLDRIRVDAVAAGQRIEQARRAP